MAAHRLGELAALLVAHVSRRGADEPGDAELLHILAHIDAHQVLLTVEQSFGQSLGQFRLAYAGRAQEQEGADGAVRVGDPRPGAEDGLADQAHGLVLTHDPPVEDVLQVEQLLPLALHQLGHRDAGPALDDAGDLFLRDLIPQQGAGSALVGDGLFGLQLLFQLGNPAVLQLRGPVQVVLPLGLLQRGVGGLQLLAELLDLADGVFFVFPLGLLGVELVPQFGQLLPDLGQMLLGQGIILFFQGGLFDFVLDDLPLDHVQLGGHGVNFGADHGAGLVDQVNGLIGQEAVGDIAVGEGGGGDDGAVLDLHAVIDLVALLQAAEDGDGVLHRGLVHQDGLEAPLQRRILLDILAVFVESGGADAVQLAPGQHGLEQIARIHGALGLAGPHDGVQLVDEQDDAAFRFFDLVQNGLQALFKLAPVLGARDQGAHIQGKDGLVLQRGGHVALHDALGQPFGDGGLADAGLADEHGVVLALAGEDADDVADLVVPADDRVQLAAPGPLHQVGTVLFQRVIGLLRMVGSDPLVATDIGQRLKDALPGDVVGAEELLERPVGGIDQRQQQMLHRDVFILHAGGDGLGRAQSFVDPGGDVELALLPAGTGDPGQFFHLRFDRGGEGGDREAQIAQQLRDQAALIGEQREQKMRLLDLLVAVFGGQSLGVLYGLQGFLGIVLRVHIASRPFGKRN